MKTVFAFLLAMMAIASAPAQNRVVKQNRQVAPFTAIDASGGWDVVIRQGSRQSVSLEVSEEILDRIEVEVKNGTLHIGNKKNSRSFSFRNLVNNRNITQRAYVTVTDLRKIDASGGVDIRFDTPLKAGDLELSMSGGSDLENARFDCKEFKGQFSGGCDAEIWFVAAQSVKVDASGGSDVQLRDMAAQSARISASGGSDVELAGRAEEFAVNASGGCDVDASGLVARNCTADFSGASDGDIHVTGRLVATVSGSADVTCAGNPASVSKTVSKSSSLKLK